MQSLRRFAPRFLLLVLLPGLGLYGCAFFPRLGSGPPRLDFPGYRQVVIRFLRQYRTDTLPRHHRWAPARKPEGWYIQRVDVRYRPLRVMGEQLFWSRSTERYQKLAWSPRRDSARMPRLLRRYRENMPFSWEPAAPYYGYPAWSRDVVADYGKHRRLSDSALFGLGIAHAHLADQLLARPVLLGSDTMALGSVRRAEPLDEAALRRYLKHRQAAIDRLSELAERSPEFATALGRVGRLRDHQRLQGYEDLCIHQRREAARLLLRDEAFSPILRQSARHYLSSMPLEGILLTQGANDHYPVRQLQAEERFRPDVLVARQDWLDYAPYRRYLVRRLGQDSAGIASALRRLGGSLPFPGPSGVRIEDRLPVPHRALRALLGQLADDSTGERTYPPSLPTPYWRMAWNGDSLRWRYPAPSLPPYQIASAALVTGLSADGPRLGWTIASQARRRLGMDPHLVLRGMTYQLRPQGGVYQPTQQPRRLALAPTLTLLRDSSFWRSLPGALDGVEKRIAANYYNVFLRTTRALLEGARPREARNLLDEMQYRLGNEVVRYDYYFVPFVELYYRADAPKKGRRMAFLILDNMQALSPGQQYPLDTRREALERLRELASAHDQPALLERIETFEKATGRGLPPADR